MGCDNSLKTQILGKNSDILVAGCNCHAFVPFSSKGADAFSIELGLTLKIVK